MAQNKKGNRQAVIVIHGIGEQRPMDTLKGFVKNLFSKKIRNKPDKMTTSFELRRLQVPGAGRYQPLTDFYEYYWAHHMRDTKLRNVLSWLKSLLLRNPFHVGKKLIPFYLILWSLFLGSTYLCYSIIDNFPSNSLVSLLWLPVIILFDYHFTRIIYGTIDDAARYLKPSPDNIEQRNKIRKEGIELLDILHKSKKYRRIVVVGHSLGSVIAYDLLRLYWSKVEVEKKYNSNSQKLLQRFTQLSNSIFTDNVSNEGNTEIQNSNQNKVDKKEEGLKEANTQKYHDLQSELWHELRSSNWPWLVTDFVTIGSPLAHGDFLLAKNNEEFEQLKAEGEYPCCPPVDGHRTYYEQCYETPEGEITSVRVPTHIAPFMCTRWSNIYFPHRKLIKGDLIGGPLKNVFGEGIKDIPVGLSGFLKEYLQSHTKYWAYCTESNVKKNQTHPSEAIKQAMDLGPIQDNKKWPEP